MWGDLRFPTLARYFWREGSVNGGSWPCNAEACGRLFFITTLRVPSGTHSHTVRPCTRAHTTSPNSGCATLPPSNRKVRKVPVDALGHVPAACDDSVLLDQDLLQLLVRSDLRALHVRPERTVIPHPLVERRLPVRRLVAGLAGVARSKEEGRLVGLRQQPLRSPPRAVRQHAPGMREQLNQRDNMCRWMSVDGISLVPVGRAHSAPGRLPPPSECQRPAGPAAPKR